MKTVNYKLQKGQSLFEVIVAVAISTLIVTAIVSLATNSIQNTSYSRDKTLASDYVEEAMEWLRQERDNNTQFKAKATETAGKSYCLDDLSTWPALSDCTTDQFISGTKFKRTLAFPSYSGGVVEATVTVSWEDSKGSHEVTSSTELSIK